MSSETESSVAGRVRAAHGSVQLSRDRAEGPRAATTMGTASAGASTKVGSPWPLVLGQTPAPAAAHQDRPSLRESVSSLLRPGRTVVLGQPRDCGPGTGKTQTAIAVFERLRPRMDLALWVTSATRTAALAAYMEARACLVSQIPRTDPPPDGDGEAIAEEFLQWLAGTHRPWLIVLDDITDPAHLAGLWPRGASGRVIATTRRKDDDLAGPGRAFVEVPDFTREESLDYLTARLAAARRPDSLHGANDLIEGLGYRPAALEQACTLLVDEALTCASLHSLLVSRAAPPGGVEVTCGELHTQLWELACERAQDPAPPHLVRRAARVVSVLDPNGIPGDVLKAPACLEYLATGRARSGGVGWVRRLGELLRLSAPVSVPAEQADYARRRLLRLGLLGPGTTTAGSSSNTAGARGLRMHATAQQSLLQSMTDADLTELVRAVADSLVQIWPDCEVCDQLGQSLRSNAAALATRHPQALWEPGVHELLFRTGRSLGQSGLALQAAAYFEELSAVSASWLGPDHPDTLAARHDSARWRGQAQDASVAVSALQELLADTVRALGTDHPNTLTARANLAYWCGQAGDPAGAVAGYRQVLTDRERVLGDRHPHTLIAALNLAHWSGRAGETEKATSLLERLRPTVGTVLGEEHTYTLVVRHELACWQRVTRDPFRAMAGLERVLADRERLLGVDHPQTLLTRRTLASWRSAQDAIAPG
ncbi:MAG: hypothetical protein QG608_1236 [Actinomycetota bacterium]|nr:hypothetical protein [Actinomycetota bacterium]